MLVGGRTAIYRVQTGPLNINPQTFIHYTIVVIAVLVAPQRLRDFRIAELRWRLGGIERRQQLLFRGQFVRQFKLLKVFDLLRTMLSFKNNQDFKFLGN